MKRVPRTLITLALLALVPQVTRGSDPVIAYEAFVASTPAIEVMDADGSNVMEVYRAMQFSPYGLEPSWSPDGKSLTFADGDPDYPGKALWRIDGVDVGQRTVWPNATLLTRNVQTASWSPAGGEIAVITTSPGTEPSAVAVIGENGGSLETIYSPTSGFDLGGGVTWNAEGSTIATFESDESSGTWDLVTIDRSSGAFEKRDVDEAVLSGNPLEIDWARLGDPRIAFTAWNGDRKSTWIYTIDTENGDLTPVVKGFGPTWSPDNSALIFRDSKDRLKRLQFSTGTQEQLGRGESPDWLRAALECSQDPDCGAGEICCGGTCLVASCEFDSDCDDGDLCTDDTCYPCSGCENVFDPTNDPSCQTCVPTHSKEKGPRCSDGLDNDCDGMIDAADPDC